jgi:hypothetical protein
LSICMHYRMLMLFLNKREVSLGTFNVSASSSCWFELYSRGWS